LRCQEFEQKLRQQLKQPQEQLQQQPQPLFQMVLGSAAVEDAFNPHLLSVHKALPLFRDGYSWGTAIHAAHGQHSSFLADGNAFMLINGSSAEKELCITVGAHNADVQLEECESAVSHGDGRDIWHFSAHGELSSELGQKCLFLGEAKEGGKRSLVLRDCDDATGALVWEPTEQNQLLVRNSEPPLCLSLASDTADSANTVDVARDQPAVASSTYGDGVAHSAARSVDGEPASYWASAPSAPGEPVVMSWPLARPVQVQSIDIEWEFPPSSFELQTTRDGVTWDVAHTVSSNPEHASTSHMPVDARQCVGVRLIMHEPDAVRGMVMPSGDRLFGIKNFRINASARHLILQECKVASQTPGAGDKWFFTHVDEFDPRQANGAEALVESSWLPSSSWARRASGFVDIGLSREDLLPLTRWRQQHRRTDEGHLCAAASVQESRVFTGCTDGPAPDKSVGRPWCYIDPQVMSSLPGGTRRWGHCQPVRDYDAMRRKL